MLAEKEKHPDQAGDLSISVIKLIGRGEYRAIGPGEKLPGHFPLGVENYTQTTASIRRGGDRVPARMLRAALAGESSPYSPSELSSMADNINQKSQDIKKAERTANKMVTATMLEDKVGMSFDAIVTGVKDGRAWCRINNPPVEGSLKASGRVRVGDKLTVQLTSVNVEKGHIDFSQRGR
jgi:exoribonuclease-2